MSDFPIIRRSDRILVLGMTGGQGTFWSERMIETGTRIVAGVSPRRAGTTHLGLPVFATAKDAVAALRVDVAVMFVPPALAGAAALDVIEAGIPGLVMLTEHIPAHDILTVFARAKAAGILIVGPTAAGPAHGPCRGDRCGQCLQLRQQAHRARTGRYRRRRYPQPSASLLTERLRATTARGNVQE